MANVVLNHTKKSFIDGGTALNAKTTNWSGIQLDIGDFSTHLNTRRGLLQWDLSSIPSGSTITAVTLKLYNTGTDLTTASRTMSVYRLRRNWVENQVTWNVYSTGNNWTTAGAGDTTNDRESGAMGTFATADPPPTGYENITITASLVQEWLDGTFTNNGVLLQLSTELNDLQRYSDTQPHQLDITYTPPASGSLNTKRLLIGVGI